MRINPNQKNPNDKKVIILGLGGSGGKIVHHIAESMGEDNEKVELIYVDSDEQSLSESTVKTVKNTDNGQTDFASLVQEMCGCQKLIITTGLGGEFGTYSSYIIYKIAKTENIQDIELILTMPAKFEGRNRKFRAMEILEVLNTNNVDYTILNYDNLIEKLDNKTRLCDCFRIMDEIVYQRIEEVVK